jgi:hypothetical protein
MMPSMIVTVVQLVSYYYLREKEYWRADIVRKQ